MVHISLNHFTLPFFCNKVIKVKRIELIQFIMGIPQVDYLNCTIKVVH
jgi:hypothetical protein